MLNEEIKQAKALLTNLYLELKIKKEYNQELIEDKIEQEKNSLKNLSIIDMINFISNYFNYLLNLQSIDKDFFELEQKETKPLYKQYEELLIKAENDIRKHIKVSIYNFVKLYKMM